MNRGGPTLTEARRAELGYGPRMTLRLTAEAYTLLESLAELLGLPRAAVIAKALAAFSAGQKIDRDTLARGVPLVHSSTHD